MAKEIDLPGGLLISCEAAISQAVTMTKPGFRNSDGWTEAKPKLKPPHRALAEIGADERQQHQRDHRHGKAQHAKPPHHRRRHHRNRDHHHQCDTAEEGLPLHIVERLQPVAGGQRHRGGQTQKETDAKQHEHRGERPFVDRPPPTWKDRLRHPHRVGAIDHVSHGVPPDFVCSARPDVTPGSWPKE